MIKTFDTRRDCQLGNIARIRELLQSYDYKIELFWQSRTKTKNTKYIVVVPLSMGVHRATKLLKALKDLPNIGVEYRLRVKRGEATE